MVNQDQGGVGRVLQFALGNGHSLFPAGRDKQESANCRHWQVEVKRPK